MIGKSVAALDLTLPSRWLDPTDTYWIVPMNVFNKLNSITPQSPIIRGPMASLLRGGAVALQVIRVAKPFKIRVHGKNPLNFRYELENVVILDEEAGVKDPIWVADAPDPAELAAKHPFFADVANLIRTGRVKARYKAYVADAENIKICSMDEPIGEVFCIPSGYVEELKPGSYAEGTVFMELWPRNAMV